MFNSYVVEYFCNSECSVLSAIMEMIFDLMSPVQLAGALAVAVVAGLVKGLVGFALPMILISGIGSFASPELALAGLILPTLVTNGMQALRHGPRAAMQSVSLYRVFLLAMLVMLLLSAQFVRVLPIKVMLLIIGVPITLFAILQLAGVPLRLARGPSRMIELFVGGFAGFIGGLSGVWGPPTIAYLTALDTEKREHVRVQGVIYAVGAVALFAAHVGSGVLNATTFWFSLILVPPCVIAMYVGAKVQDRINQAAFRQATLVVLLIAGLNLLRRGLFT